MKYTNSLVAFLFFFLGVTLTSFIPIVSADQSSAPSDAPFDCAGYVPEKPIDNFQLKTVGVSDLDANQDQDDKKPSPVRVYLNKFGMTVHLFFEGHPEHVLDTTLIDVALYAASDASGVSSGRRRMDDRKVEFGSVSPTAGIASSFKGEDEVLKRRHSLSAASDASDVSSDRHRVDDRSVTVDSVSLIAGIASSFKGEDEVLKRRLMDCTACDDFTTEITTSGTAFQAQVAQCIGRWNKYCPEDVPIGCWDTSKVTDMSNAFSGQASFDDSIYCWNTARVNRMDGMFDGASNFNQPINDWDVASVTSMKKMFNKASTFNQPLDDLDVTNVVDMGNMFYQATNFNQRINDWDVANVDTMGGMFYKANNFNQPLDDWNPASVSSFASMFNQAYAFNQSLDDWNMPSVTSMKQMFFQATKFDQCLSTWADKTPPDVDVFTIFDRTSCPNTSDPDPSVGPWCQEQGCAPSEQTDTSSAGTPPPCGENGVALPTTLYNVNLVSYNDDNYNGFFTQLDDSQCFPRTTNGVVAQAEIEMTENPLDLDSNLASLIYDASVGTNDGQLQFCARIAYYIDDVDAAEVTWKKYDSTDCVGAHTEINGSKYFIKQQSEFTVEAMLAQCKSMCELDDACVAFNFRDDREHPDYPFGNESLCQFWSTITATPDAADGLNSKDCWVSKELISYIDTKVVLDVSIAADIEFTQAVDISSDQTPVTTVNQDVSAVIEVDSFLCGDPGENGGAPYGDAYSLGQSFRVCVDVKATDEDKFRLTNFGEVKCSTNSGLESIIIRLVAGEAIASSVLTTLFNNDATAGAKSVASGTPSTQIEASERAISFSTVVTNAYLTGDDDTLTCVGSVDVDTVTQRRQLVSFTVPNPVSSSLSSGRRRMEEETGAVAGAVDFGATIKLSLSSSSSVTASGPFPLWATTTTLVIALVVGWSL